MNITAEQEGYETKCQIAHCQHGATFVENLSELKRTVKLEEVHGNEYMVHYKDQWDNHYVYKFRKPKTNRKFLGE